jgi:hypothetical protein
MDNTEHRYEDPNELAAQLEHADRLITELMDRVDAREVELALYWLADAAGGAAA